jgi:ubiquinone/menaquinone biosynthesis C-methylase UbiE
VTKQKGTIVIVPKSIYDNREFFEKYLNYRRQPNNYTDKLIWPVLYALLPQIKNADIIDIGAGCGGFLNYAIQKGAASVTAVDNSTLMFSQAQENIDDLRISYHLEDIETFETQENQFDLAISSMTFHYIRDLTAVFRKIYKWLKSGGILVFSMNHPNYTSALNSESVKRWENEGIQIIDNYFEEGERSHHWLVPKVVKYHVRMETILNGLIDVGFKLEQIEEPTVNEKFVQPHPSLQNVARTTFGLVIRASKPLNK